MTLQKFQIIPEKPRGRVSNDQNQVQNERNGNRKREGGVQEL
jgi:hypothetical protein